MFRNNGDHMKIKILAVFVILSFAFMIPSNVMASNPGSQMALRGAVSEVRDLGWVTHASSNFSLHREDNTSIETEWGMVDHRFNLDNEWNMTVSCGASLPVNLTVAVPDNATPGENLTIDIGLFSLEGYVFFLLLGEHYLELNDEFSLTQEIPPNQTVETEYEFFLRLLSEYMLNLTVGLKTPIGLANITLENVTEHLGTFSLELEMSYYNSVDNETVENEVEVEASVDVYLNFDLNVIANTSVIGTVNISGTAAAEPGEITLVWTQEGWKAISVAVTENATEEDTLNVDITLAYKVYSFSIEYKDIDLIIDVDELSIEAEIEEFVNETQMLTVIEMQMSQLIESYIDGEYGIPFNLVGTELLEGTVHVLESESNTIESESPYDELVALYIPMVFPIVESTEEQSPGEMQPFLGTETILVGVSIIAALIVASYIIISRRNST